MAFDFKKEYKEFYAPTKKPGIITAPRMKYVAARGQGDPNEENGAYQRAINVLYGVAYTVKMSKMGNYKIPGYFDYVVPPLEGFWRANTPDGLFTGDKSALAWISCIRLPDFVTEDVFRWAVEEATRKKKADFSQAEFLTVEEGLCVQCMHVGSYDAEPETIAVMRDYAESLGFEFDLSDERRHHEIYLSDPRRVATEKLKTVVRLPIREA